MHRMPIRDASSVTLRDVRAWLSSHLREGAKCPACRQTAKVYRRNINSTMARAIIKLYLHGGAHDFVHAPSLPGDTHEISQLSWWGLVEEERVTRADGGRAGYWKLTELGLRFVTRREGVEQYALIYDGTLIRLEGDIRNIEDCLGARFNYSELMLA